MIDKYSKIHDLGMLENFSSMIEMYGMIPNGNRVYYTKRSQPPLFIAMVEEFYKVCDFLVCSFENMVLFDYEISFQSNTTSSFQF